MQLYAKKAEVRAIKTLTDTSIKISKRLEFLGHLKEDHFNLGPTKAAYRRLSKVAQKKATLLDWEDLLEDPALEESIRDELHAFRKAASCESSRRRRLCLDLLENYRKKRSLYGIAKFSLEALDEEAIDIDEVLDSVGSKLGQTRRDLANEETILNIGRNSNIDATLDEMLDGTGEKMLKTGFRDYDDVNGGLPSSGLMILAATTSGGKSVLSMNLLKNMLQENDDCDVFRVSLEMTDIQELKRLSSNLTGIPFWKIKQNKLNKGEKRTIREAVHKYTKELQTKSGKNKKGNQYSFVAPKRSMTISDVLNMARPFGHKVLCIDYISLLEGVDDDNQWRMLSAIARESKIYATETDTLIVLLAQLDADSNNLRYSRGMKEHCDILWFWNYASEEQRETHVLPIKTGKARDGELVNFDLDERYDIMSVFNAGDGDKIKVVDNKSNTATTMDDLELSSDDIKKKKKKGKKKKKKKSKDEEYDIS